MHARWVTGLGIAFALACVSANANAQRVHLSIAGVHPVGEYESHAASFGAIMLVGLELPFAGRFGVGPEGGQLILGEKPRPSRPDASGDRTLVGLALSARLGSTQTKSGSAAPGFWLGLTGGQSFVTNDAYGFGLAKVGYDTSIGDSFGWGPVVGYSFAGGEPPTTSTTQFVLAGLHAFVDIAPPMPKAKAPPGDRDFDHIVDPKDQCLDDPEDYDGFEDEDGCPDYDLDKDGILDDLDHCPDDPEDRDDFEDEDGCPENDNDQDGVLDDFDKCPLEAETKNDYADEDGCPDEVEVRVVANRILLDEKVRFATNSDVIEEGSHELLMKVVKLLTEHPEYVELEVQGYADERGDAQFNLNLSGRRAASVLEFLVKNGVQRSRLKSRGYGESRTVQADSAEASLDASRRVEFAILKKKVATKPAKKK